MDKYSATVLIAAGHVKEDCELFGILQNISLEQANILATWLALATDGPVKLQHIDGSGVVDIERTGATDPQIKIEREEIKRR